MKWIKNDKGFTGIDMAIAFVVIFIFVSMISLLIYNINSGAKEIELKTEATYLAIDTIETIKSEGFEAYANRSQAAGNSIVCEQEEIEGNQGFFKTIIVIDYADIAEDENVKPNLVKKATAKISYMFKAQEQTIELSTILSKENES